MDLDTIKRVKKNLINHISLNNNKSINNKI